MKLSVPQSGRSSTVEAVGEGTGLLMFAYYFPPLNTSGAQRPFRFAKYLRRHHIRAHVITASAQEEGAPWKDVTEADDRMARSGKARLGALVGKAIQRVLPYNDEIPWASYAVSAAVRLVPAVRPVAMLSTSPPVAGHVAALWTKWRFGTPWIADFRDPFYGNPLRPRKLSRPYAASLEQLIVRNADAVITNTDSAAEVFRKRYPRFEQKIHTIWNGYDPEETLRASPLPKRDHKVLLHAGTVYAARHPKALIGSLARLIQRGRINPDGVRLRLVGWLEPTNEPWTQEPAFAALQSRGCLELESEMPQSEAIREMAQADYLLLLDLNDTGMSVQVPAKLFQYIRIGRPILAYTAAQSPCERILAKCGTPHITIQSSASEDRMDESVAALFDLPSEPIGPSLWFEEQFNAESQTKTLASIIREVST
jgi:glycosyltransferase involved in cell wall biosynthesis